MTIAETNPNSQLLVANIIIATVRAVKIAPANEMAVAPPIIAASDIFRQYPRH